MQDVCLSNYIDSYRRIIRHAQPCVRDTVLECKNSQVLHQHFVVTLRINIGWTSSEVRTEFTTLLKCYSRSEANHNPKTLSIVHHWAVTWNARESAAKLRSPDGRSWKSGHCLLADVFLPQVGRLNYVFFNEKAATLLAPVLTRILGSFP